MELAKETIEKSGGAFHVGDAQADFSVPTPVGEVEGNCVLADLSTVTIVITRKPFFVPCSAIKSKIVRCLVEMGASGA
ncbi:MAG: hypothetical protein HC802_04425 [Caldilineaceae bacterium]|nr:hypothetical protein [Caldilineaceae bacterium]